MGALKAATTGAGAGVACVRQSSSKTRQGLASHGRGAVTKHATQVHRQAHRECSGREAGGGGRVVGVGGAGAGAGGSGGEAGAQGRAGGCDRALGRPSQAVWRRLGGVSGVARLRLGKHHSSSKEARNERCVDRTGVCGGGVEAAGGKLAQDGGGKRPALTCSPCASCCV